MADYRRKESAMKKKLTRLAALLMVMMTVLAFTGCGASEPKTLEEYIDQNPDARTKIEEAVASQGVDEMMDVDVNYEGNKVMITCSLKTTYDEDIIDAVIKAYQEKESDLEGTVMTAISEIESDTGIDGVSIDVTIRNGDGSEIWKQHYEDK